MMPEPKGVFTALQKSAQHAARLRRATFAARGLVDFNHPWQTAMHRALCRASPAKCEQFLLTLTLNL